MPRKPSSPEPTARRLAVEILTRIERGGAYAEPLLDAHLSRGCLRNAAERRLLTQLVYGTLRMRGHLDWIIARLYRGNPKALPIAMRNILRTGIYQISFMDRIPPFAAVDEAVKLSGGSGLVNAVLRNALRRRAELPYPEMARDPEEHIAVIHSHPPWLVRRWIARMGPEATLLACRANNEIPPVTVRVNTLKTHREALSRELAQAGFSVAETVFSPDGLRIEEAPHPLRKTDAFREGRLLLQDEASQLIARLVAPRPGERILDACAGTGGKTSHLAALMEGKGFILATDKSSRKIGILRELMASLGVTIVEGLAADATATPREDHTGTFDRGLVDAPCSGLGTLRRNPEIKWRLEPAHLERFAALQKAVLHRTAACVRPGGILVYSTCSVMAEENEDVIAAFLARHPEFTVYPPPESFPRDLTGPDGFFRSSPTRGGMDGFFGAVLQRAP